MEQSVDQLHLQLSVRLLGHTEAELLDTRLHPAFQKPEYSNITDERNYGETWGESHWDGNSRKTQKETLECDYW